MLICFQLHDRFLYNELGLMVFPYAKSQLPFHIHQMSTEYIKTGL